MSDCKPFATGCCGSTPRGNGPQDISPPEKGRLYQGLKPLNIPFNFDAPVYAEHRLKGSEIEALLFGHRIHGRNRRTGRDYGLYISPDGTSATGFGEWGASGASETVYVKSDRLCIVDPTQEWCGMIFRNPGGTRAKENEYFTFDNWANPFSPVD